MSNELTIFNASSSFTSSKSFLILISLDITENLHLIEYSASIDIIIDYYQ